MKKTKWLFISMVMLAIPMTLASCGDEEKADEPDNPNSSSILKPEINVSGKHNGYEYVDLGLSVKWATCNVGATKPEGPGYYISWGETQQKAHYSISESKWWGKSTADLENEGAIRITNSSTKILTAKYDAASVKMGGKWRLPSIAEFKELIEKCTWTKLPRYGITGYLVTGPNGNSLYLPSYGIKTWNYKNGDEILSLDSRLCYWTRNIHKTDKITSAFSFDNMLSSVSSVKEMTVDNGHQLRAVVENPE